MLAYLKGTLTAREAGRVVLETPSGVGWVVLVPDTTAAALPEPGRAVKLLTHLVIREDSWQLAGFLTHEERDVFLALLGVSGVGVKLALAIVGQVTPDGIREAVRDAAWKRLVPVSGVGPKLAQRITVELRGVLAPGPEEGSVARVADPSPPDEVVQGLVALGYTEAEAEWAVRGADGPGASARLREALRRLDSGKGADRAGRAGAS